MYNASYLISHRTLWKERYLFKVIFKNNFFCKCSEEKNRYKSWSPCHIYQDVESVTDAFEGETTQRVNN